MADGHEPNVRCDQCGNAFYVKASRLASTRFCSRECHGAWRRAQARPALKRCSGCKAVLPIESFGASNRADRGGRAYRASKCPPCRAKDHDPLAARKSVLRTRYGLTWDAFNAMLAAQGGGCAICFSKEPRGKGSWHIDHDHSCCPTDSSKGIVKTCGKCVRGILCHQCNTGLGNFRDDRQLLHFAVQYLESRM